MRRSWQGLAAMAAIGAAVIGAGVSSAGGATQATAGTASAAMRQAPAPPFPHGTVRAHSSGGGMLYLQMPGAPGEVVAPGYGNAIQIYSFSWGVSNNVSGKATWSSMNLQAQLDRATPVLESWAETGHVTRSAVLTDTDSTGKTYRVVLGNVTVQTVSLGAAAGGGVPSVSYNLGFTSEENDDFYNGTVVKNCWDSATNTATCPSPPA